ATASVWIRGLSRQPSTACVDGGLLPCGSSVVAPATGGADSPAQQVRAVICLGQSGIRLPRRPVADLLGREDCGYVNCQIVPTPGSGGRPGGLASGPSGQRCAGPRCA